MPLEPASKAPRLRSASLFLACGLLPCLPAQAFDTRELQGTWAESRQNQYACTPTNRRQTIELSADGRTLAVTIQHKTGSRRSEVLKFDITKTDEHSVYFRFPGSHEPPDPMAGEWAITLLGPGVYRWHVVSAHEGAQPAPIGIRCEP